MEMELMPKHKEEMKESGVTCSTPHGVDKLDIIANIIIERIFEVYQSKISDLKTIAR